MPGEPALGQAHEQGGRLPASVEPIQFRREELRIILRGVLETGGGSVDCRGGAGALRLWGGSARIQSPTFPETLAVSHHQDSFAHPRRVRHSQPPLQLARLLQRMVLCLDRWGRQDDVGRFQYGTLETHACFALLLQMSIVAYSSLCKRVKARIRALESVRGARRMV